MLDLATGHGKFAIAAHDMGWRVTAVDVRTERMPSKQGIDWVQADVREYPTDGFDVITIFGLLYHLELPAQADLLRRCGDALTIIDTHVSLDPRTTIDGYEGHFYTERGGLLASWGNESSFWPTEESLLRLIRSAGLESILQVVPPPVRPDRTFYVVSRTFDEHVSSVMQRFPFRRYRLEVCPVAEQSIVAGEDTEPGSGATKSERTASSELDRIRLERDQAVADLERLRARKSVKAALAVARLAKPGIEAARRLRT